MSIKVDTKNIISEIYFSKVDTFYIFDRINFSKVDIQLFFSSFAFSRMDTLSEMAWLGYSMKDIQEWLGHADYTLTANTYSHIDMSEKFKMVNSIGENLSF